MTLEERIALGEDPSLGALPNSMTVEELSERQFSRNELICTCLSRCPIMEEIPDVSRTTIMDRRGEGVPVILGASRALSQKTPEYRLIDGCELKLTIRCANANAENRSVNNPVNDPVNDPVSGGVSGGVKRLLNTIQNNPGKRVPELAQMTGASVRTIERQLKQLSSCVEFRGAPKNGGYYAITGDENKV